MSAYNRYVPPAPLVRTFYLTSSHSHTTDKLLQLVVPLALDHLLLAFGQSVPAR